MAKINSNNAVLANRDQANAAQERFASLIATFPKNTWHDWWENNAGITGIRTSRTRVFEGPTQKELNKAMVILRDFCQAILPAGSWRIGTRTEQIYSDELHKWVRTPLHHNALIVWYKAGSGTRLTPHLYKDYNYCIWEIDTAAHQAYNLKTFGPDAATNEWVNQDWDRKYTIAQQDEVPDETNFLVKIVEGPFKSDRKCTNRMRELNGWPKWDYKS